MIDFDAALTGFAALDEEALARPWPWRDKQMDVRYALYRTLEDAHEAQRAFGDLRGLLVGLPADLLDQAPRAGEWPVRETLRHMLAVERRYALQTRYAAERADGEPVRMADDRLPALTQADGGGEIGPILARLAQARAETNRWLGNVAPAAMTRPTVWASHEVDVRFRLHRNIAAVIGELEGLGALADAREVEARLAERFASVGP